MPQRLYTLDELRLNGIETLSLLSPVDTTLGSIERNLQIAAIVGGLAAWNAFAISPQQIFYISLGLLFLWTLDAVSFGGGIGGLVVDTIGHSFSQKYHNRVIQVRFMPFSYCPLKIILFLINNLHLLNDSYVTITKFNYAA